MDLSASTARNLITMLADPRKRAGDGVPARVNALQDVVFPALKVACARYGLTEPDWLASFTDDRPAADRQEPYRTGGSDGLHKSLKFALLFKGGCGKGGCDTPNLSQTLRDAHHANRHAVSASCDHENADKVMIAGENGKKYPATHCKRCGRVAMDDKKHHGLAHGKVPLDVLAKAVAAGLYNVSKAAGQTWSEKLQDSHPGSHWVHLQGKAILILHDGKQLPESEMSAARGKGRTTPTDETATVYQKHGTKSPHFKAWFGDWGKAGTDSSKVTNPDGSPAVNSENHSAVEKDGEPLSVYHGTADSGFKSFDTDRTSSGSLYGAGFYFTQNKDIASLYAEQSTPSGTTPGVKQAYLNIRKPLRMDEAHIGSDAAQSIIDAMQKQGVKPKGVLNENSSGEKVWAFLRRSIGTSRDAPVNQKVVRILKAAGYDGITHIDGVKHSGVGVKGDGIKHRVWIAWEPAQVKDVQNVGTFDSAEPDMYKSLAGGLYKGVTSGTGIPTLHSLAEVHAMAKQHHDTKTPLYVRWSGGVDGDKAMGWKSKNHASGEKERGLSVEPVAAPLANPEMMPKEYHPTQPHQIGAAINHYATEDSAQYSPKEDGSTPKMRPYLTHGDCKAAGSDGEPLLTKVKPLAYLSANAIHEGKRASLIHNVNWSRNKFGNDHATTVAATHDLESHRQQHPRVADVSPYENAGDEVFKSITKAVGSNCYKDPKSCDLRWITAHPNGAEPGVALLVHDNGEEYTVVGGAGGSMNQQVFQKPKGDASGNERKAQRKEKRIARQKAAREALGSDAQDLEDKKAALHAEAKRQTDDLTNRVLSALGDHFSGNALEKVASEAKKRAVKEHASATEGEQKEFADDAAKEAVKEAQAAARKVVQAALNSAAMRALGDGEGATPMEFAASISGKQLVKKFTPEELDSFVQSSASIAALKGKAKAIQRALATGDQDAVQGIQVDCAPISAEQASAQNLTRYLTEDSVNKNTALVKGSEQASTVTQRRNQANGASDGLNSFVAAQTGSAILRPETVKTLGVENAARVAAAYLTESGKDGGSTAEGLRDRIAQTGYASVKAALDKVDEMDQLVKGSKEAAGQGDGSVTTAQASICAANMANIRYRLLNTTRGQLRAAGALAHHLESPSQRSMSLPAGSSAIAAHAFAKGLGLKEGDYAVEKSAHGEGGGYKVKVEASNLHKMAQKHSTEESTRNIEMDELRQDVEQNAGAWHPEGFSPNAMLMPHQELAARAIVQNKRMVLNYGAGSGKTPTAYAAAADLLSSGKCKQGLITMPAKPRAQQDGEDGEAAKFLTPEMAGKVAVVKDGSDLKRCLRQIASGEKSILIMSPHLMREKVDDLKAAGFGGDKSFYFADEAHEFAIGSTEGTGSGMAKAAHVMAGSEYAAAMSGTLIENNASELHSLYDMMHPGALGSQKAFTDEWKRLAQGGNDFFSSESMRGMRDRLSGGMVSYHKPVTDKETGEALTLDKKTVTVKASPAQKEAISKINDQYQKDRKSEDTGKAKAAALRREASTKRVLTLGVKQSDGSYANPKYDAVKQIMDDEKARDPKNRVGIYAFERKPLAAAGKAAGGKMVQVTGDDDDKATKASVDAINDRNNDTDGIMLSNAGNYGLNLQGMDHLIKMHAIDTPSKEDQLDHRHFRTGQTRNVRATTILTDHPSEQLAQFRTTQVKLPEVALLATLADDSKAASLLAPRMRELKAAAAS